MEVKGVRAKSGRACSTAEGRVARDTNTSEATNQADGLKDQAIESAHTNSNDAGALEECLHSVADGVSAMPAR